MADFLPHVDVQRRERGRLARKIPINFTTNRLSPRT